MAIETLESDWDRTLLYLSSCAATPLCDAFKYVRFRTVAPLDTTKFNLCKNKVAEIATRIFIILVATLACLPLLLPIVFLGTASKVLRFAGFALQQNNYTHVKGKAPEIELKGQAKIMTWNLCGIGGGMHYDHGGVISWEERIDGIVDKIKEADPDVLILQEIYDTAFAEALMEKLGPRYAHFFTHLGANTMGSVGGLMVASKCAVHSFTNTSFDNNDWTLNRTFASLQIKAKPTDTTPCARIIGTHLIHDSNDNRLAQVAQIAKSIAKENLALPTILAGDFNIERDQNTVLDSMGTPSYIGNEPTRTGELLKQWDPNATDVASEIIDNIYLLNQDKGNATLGEAKWVRAFDETFNTNTALSDHHGLVADLFFQKLSQRQGTSC
jgi:endonuclease/exonuclease/phosphatase family metal-dependent hydrolase